MMITPYQKWEQKHVETNQELASMTRQFIQDSPTIGGFDTETTGLQIVKDKPFLIQFG